MMDRHELETAICKVTEDSILRIQMRTHVRAAVFTSDIPSVNLAFRTNGERLNAGDMPSLFR